METRKMFTKEKIGRLTIKNRIIMTAIGNGYSQFTGEATDQSIRYYEARAKGGVGMIITEFSRIDDKTGLGVYGQLSASSSKFIRRLVELVDTVHQYDAKIFMQLHHPGRQVSSTLIHGNQPVAPSPIPSEVVQELPRALSTAECEALVQKFINGAMVAKTAGFDGVELHGAHGYLINQFLSPLTNKRTDRYGGSFEKRLEFVTEIIHGIQSTCGKNFPISVRISADEYMDGGLKITDSVKIAQSLEKLGIAVINVSAGIYETAHGIVEPYFLPSGWKKNLAETIRRAVKIPVIATNNVKTPAMAEKLLQAGVSDFVGVARGNLADPEWVNKAYRGEEHLIRQCIGCLYCFQTLLDEKPVECTVNPLVGREFKFSEATLEKVTHPEDVAVVGAGPSGMQAAYVLAKRGYKVTIFDKNATVGGTMILAAKPKAKDLINCFIETQKQELLSENVKFSLGNAVNPEQLKNQGYDRVALTAGGTPIKPNLPGINQDNVIFAEDYLAGNKSIEGKKVVIVGGGVTGLETAEMLGVNNEVTVVEMLDDVAKPLYTVIKNMLLANLKKEKVVILTSHQLVGIEQQKVTVQNTKNHHLKDLTADTVVLALGVHPDEKLLTEYEITFAHVMVAGDAQSSGQIASALREANDKAFIF